MIGIDHADLGANGPTVRPRGALSNRDWVHLSLSSLAWPAEI